MVLSSSYLPVDIAYAYDNMLRVFFFHTYRFQMHICRPAFEHEPVCKSELPFSPDSLKYLFFTEKGLHHFHVVRVGDLSKILYALAEEVLSFFLDAQLPVFPVGTVLYEMTGLSIHRINAEIILRQSLGYSGKVTRLSPCISAFPPSVI